MTVSAASGLLWRIWRRLRGTRQSPSRVALAVAIGLFIGCLPLYGAHFLLCSLICVPFGLDLLLCYLVANISNPLVAPFLITLEVELGSLVTTGKHAAFTLARAKQTGFLGFVWQAGVGSVFVGSGLAALGAAIAYAVAGKSKDGTLADSDADASDDLAQLEAATLRTIERYRAAPVGDRIYVAAKLRSDPLTRLLAALPGDFGSVLDAGAGRGQFGLLLLELGRCHALAGFDGDPRKVKVARLAARDSAHFEHRDLLALPEAEVDTLLLIDVLHYLPLHEQDELLGACTRVARSRIVIRELDAVAGARNFVTRAGEWLTKLTGYNRGRSARHYRPASAIAAQLTRLGFSCDVQGASKGTPFGNVLVVAEKASLRGPSPGTTPDHG
jgi:uncharacterized protein (DUF2062 family)/SAM-dependent methyltransferase